jgi:hypothetical protein
MRICQIYFLRVLILWIGLQGLAEAHLGFENDAEVRLYQEQMRLVIRTSPSFATLLLEGIGSQMNDPAGREAAEHLLAGKANELFTVTAAGVSLEPTSAECKIEPHDDVAFVVNYPRPPEGAVEFRANYFDRLTNLDTGTITVFDQGRSKFRQEVEPLARKILNANDSTLRVELRSKPLAKVEGQPLRVASYDREKIETSPVSRQLYLTSSLLASSLVAALIYYRWKRANGVA